jgi:hypothetical protein
MKIKKKKNKRIKKEHKKNYDSILNADSMWNRQSSIKKSKSGKDIQKLLGIGDEEDYKAEEEPMKMMDIVLQSWENKNTGKK